MMPKRVAATDPNTQISDFTGSGPFIFKADEWKPGDKAVYLRNPKYKPRAEPASARRLGVSPNTIKTHLRKVFAKTRTSRQTELARLVGSISLMLGDGSRS